MFSRFAAYYKRHGFAVTARRTTLAVRRAFVANREVLFYCDLSKQLSPPADNRESSQLERKRTLADLRQQDLEQIVSVWNPKLAHERLEERFSRGASLWLIKVDHRLAGYGWTLQGQTIEPHYFPLGERDVHFFDFHVFPQYRGQGLNPLLVSHILNCIASETGGRAFIEAAEWNHPQLSSLSRTPFRRLGWARKLTMFSRTIVCWSGGDAARHGEEDLCQKRHIVLADGNRSDVSRYTQVTR